MIWLSPHYVLKCSSTVLSVYHSLHSLLLTQTSQGGLYYTIILLYYTHFRNETNLFMPGLSFLLLHDSKNAGMYEIYVKIYNNMVRGRNWSFETQSIQVVNIVVKSMGFGFSLGFQMYSNTKTRQRPCKGGAL